MKPNRKQIAIYRPEPAREHPAGAPWSKQDAAGYLGISTKTIESYAKRNIIKTISFGRLVKIPDSEVRRLANFGVSQSEPLGTS